MATVPRAFASWPKKPDNLKFDTRRQHEKGRGSFGAVYKGEFYGRPVAVKILHNRNPSGEFEKESSILKGLNHPNIVKLLGTFWDDEEGGRPLLVMEYQEENLKQYLARNKGKLAVGRQMEIAQEIIEGLCFLHKQNIVHRDLKLENILVGVDGHVRIGDFGQSKLLNNLGEDMKTTQPGTVAYMPPEALEHGCSKYNAKIDVFSLGVVFACIATQREPTVGMLDIGSKPELKRRAEDLQPLSRGHPLEFFINFCLQDNSENRPDAFMVHHSLTPLIQGIVHLPDIQSRLETTEKRKESLEEKLKKTEEQIKKEKIALEDRMTTTEKEKMMLKEERAKLKREIMVMKDNCASLEDCMTTTEKEKMMLKEERAKLKMKTVDMAAERDMLKMKTAETAKKCASLQRNLDQTQMDNRKMKVMLQQTLLEKDMMQEQLEGTRMEKQNVEDRMRTTEKENEKLKKVLDETRKELTDKQYQLETHQKKQKNLQELLEEQSKQQREQLKRQQQEQAKMQQEQAKVQESFHSRMIKCLHDGSN